MTDMETEIFAPKTKTRAKGFGSVDETEEELFVEVESSQPIPVQEEPEVIKVVEEPKKAVKSHTQLVRPMPRKKSVPQRGAKSATQLRP